jgi:hypothetical protein
MNNKFSAVPVEEDTKVLRRAIVSIGGWEALHERWSWEGVKGETMVFVSEEVERLSDKQLEALVRQSELVEPNSQITMKRGESGYTFINFNFRS